MKGDEIIGANVVAEVKRSKIGTAGKTQDGEYLQFYYTGGDTRIINETYNSGVELGIIEKKGPWLVWGERKFQGQKKIFEALAEDSSLLQELQSDIEAQRN
jgi:hypothetical protein